MRGECSGPECARSFNAQENLTGSNSTVKKRVKRGWRLPPELHCFCARSISCRFVVRFARESSGTVLQTAPGFVRRLAGVLGGTLSLANIACRRYCCPIYRVRLSSHGRMIHQVALQHSLIVRLARGGLHHDPNCNVSSSVSQWHDLRRAAAWCLAAKSGYQPSLCLTHLYRHQSVNA